MTTVTLFPLVDKYSKGKIRENEYDAYIGGQRVGTIYSRKGYRNSYYFHTDCCIYAREATTLAEMKRNICRRATTASFFLPLKAYAVR